MTVPKKLWITLLALVTPFSAIAGKDKKDEEKEEPKDPNRLFFEDFEEIKTGEIPDDYFVIEGDWEVVELDGGKALKLSRMPLMEASIQLAKSLKEKGATITALIRAEGKRRSFPRFGVALHGMSGFRLRVVPVRKIVELVKNDEQIASAPFQSPKGVPVRLKLRAEKKDTRWEIRGWAWLDGKDEPAKPILTHTATDVRLSGKASVTGTPYAGLPIFFDDIEIRKYPEEEVVTREE